MKALIAEAHSEETTNINLPLCEDPFYNNYSLGDVLKTHIVRRAIKLEDLECSQELETELMGQNTTTFCSCEIGRNDDKSICEKQQKGLGNTAGGETPVITSQTKYTHGYVNTIDYPILPGEKLQSQIPTTAQTDSPTTSPSIPIELTQKGGKKSNYYNPNGKKGGKKEYYDGTKKGGKKTNYYNTNGKKGGKTGYYDKSQNRNSNAGSVSTGMQLSSSQNNHNRESNASSVSTLIVTVIILWYQTNCWDD